MSGASFDVISYLAGKGLKGRSASGGREMVYACFLDCAEPADSRKRKLYINVEEGLFSCFAGDTLVVTREGIRPIAELAGGVHEIVTTGGGWVKAPFYHFGRQPVRTITLSRNKVTKTIRATSEHRWLREAKTRAGRRRSWTTTDQLKPGMLLASELPESVHPELDLDGVRHGIVFGDGSRGSLGGSWVVLHPPKVELAELFDNSHETARGIRAGRLPRHYKELPDLSLSLEYLAGWLAGYIATDGAVDGSGNVSISSVSTAHLRRVREVAALLGVASGTIATYQHSGGSLDLGEHSLSRVTLYGSIHWLLLRNLHRTRAAGKGAGPQRLRWRVVDVSEALAEEDVYCGVVEGTETFLLDDFILTGNCKVCGSAGGSYTLQRHFGDDPHAGTTDDTFTRRQILDWAADVGAQMLANRDDVLIHLFTERGLSPETITERQLGFVADGWSLTGSLPDRFSRDQLLQTGLVWKDGPRKGTDYFYRHLLIPVMHHGHVVQIRGRIWGEARGGKYLSGPGEPVRAFNIDSLDGATEAILCEGEIDAIRLHEVLKASPEERLRKIAVVGLPGTSAYPEELDDYLTDIRRIFIGFDSDEPGRLAADRLREKYGARARVLQLPNIDGRKADWGEFLLPVQDRRGFEHEHPYAGHDASDVLRLMSEAAGKRIHSVAEAGAAFRAYRATHTGLRTGWTQLDAVIAPGLLPGQIVFLLARTGAGKTVILCNLAYQMRRHGILFVSLEMTREEVYHRLQRIYWHHHPTASIHELEYAFSNVWICDENRLGEKDIQALVNEYAMENGVNPEVVFVDYLGYYARGARGSSPYEKTTNAAMQLKADAKAGRLVIISPAQVNRVAKDGKPIDLDEARDSGAVGETGDFVLAAYRPDDALVEGIVNVPPTYRVKLSVLKSRHGGVGKVISLQMDALTLAIAEEGTRAAKTAEEHNILMRRGLTWDALRVREVAPRQMTMPGTAS